jgi:hypothetical protein
MVFLAVVKVVGQVLSAMHRSTSARRILARMAVRAAISRTNSLVLALLAIRVLCAKPTLMNALRTLASMAVFAMTQ